MGGLANGYGIRNAKLLFAAIHPISLWGNMKDTTVADNQTIEAKFFEEYPLYRKFRVSLPDNHSKISFPGIRLFCSVCSAEHTFTLTQPVIANRQANQLPPPQNPVAVAGKIALLEYTCASCKDYKQSYLIYFDPKLQFVMKAGQYPSWAILVDRGLADVLGAYKDTYQKGLICEAQGYGIGAYAYYRRIVEQIIDSLLDTIDELIDGDRREIYDRALAETKKVGSATEKIALVKDLLPSSLRPERMNPLGILYDALSAGIHAKTDEECLELACSIRETVVFLIGQIQRTISGRASERNFTDNMKRILEKRT